MGKGYYKIIAEHSGKALTVENDTRKAGVNVVQKKWVANSDTQLWKFVSTGEGYYIRSKQVQFLIFGALCMHHIQIFGRIQQMVVWHRNGIWKRI